MTSFWYFCRCWSYLKGLNSGLPMPDGHNTANYSNSDENSCCFAEIVRFCPLFGSVHIQHCYWINVAMFSICWHLSNLCLPLIQPQRNVVESIDVVSAKPNCPDLNISTWSLADIVVRLEARSFFRRNMARSQDLGKDWHSTFITQRPLDCLLR